MPCDTPSRLGIMLACGRGALTQGKRPFALSHARHTMANACAAGRKSLRLSAGVVRQSSSQTRFCREVLRDGYVLLAWLQMARNIERKALCSRSRTVCLNPHTVDLCAAGYWTDFRPRPEGSLYTQIVTPGREYRSLGLTFPFRREALINCVPHLLPFVSRIVWHISSPKTDAVCA